MPLKSPIIYLKDPVVAVSDDLDTLATVLAQLVPMYQNWINSQQQIGQPPVTPDPKIISASATVADAKKWLPVLTSAYAAQGNLNALLPALASYLYDPTAQQNTYTIPVGGAFTIQLPQDWNWSGGESSSDSTIIKPLFDDGGSYAVFQAVKAGGPVTLTAQVTDQNSFFQNVNVIVAVYDPKILAPILQIAAKLIGHVPAETIKTAGDNGSLDLTVGDFYQLLVPQGAVLMGVVSSDPTILAVDGIVTGTAAVIEALQPGTVTLDISTMPAPPAQIITKATLTVNVAQRVMHAWPAPPIGHTQPIPPKTCPPTQALFNGNCINMPMDQSGNPLVQAGATSGGGGPGVMQAPPAGYVSNLAAVGLGISALALGGVSGYLFGSRKPTAAAQENPRIDEHDERIRVALGTLSHNRQFTISEFAQTIHVGSDDARKIVHKLVRHGFVEQTSSRPATFHPTKTGWGWIEGPAA